MRDIYRVLLLALAIGPAHAEDLAVKLFAGSFESATQLQQQLRSEVSVSLADSSVIACDIGAQFGVAYMLKISRKQQRASKVHVINETWTHPALGDLTTTTRELPLEFKRRQSMPQFSGWQLTEDALIDGDVTLTLSLEGQTYLSHIFQVMGCTAESRQALNQALENAQSDELVCEQIVQVGSRLKQTICRPRVQIDLMQDRARDEIRLRRNSGGPAVGSGDGG